MLKMVILWKKRMQQRTESVECVNFLDQTGQENKIFIIMKDREAVYRRHTVPVTSCSEVKYVLKKVIFGSNECNKELKV